MPERDFIHGYEIVRGLPDVEPERLRLMALERLDEAFPFHPALPERILLRLVALMTMWRHPRMEAWKTAPGAAGLRETAMRIAATHPVSESDGFAPESFFAEMLRRVNGDGSA